MSVDATGINQVLKITSDLKFWTYYNSWTFCRSCNFLNTNIMPFNFTTHLRHKFLRKCPCQETRCVIPKYDKITTVLLSLTSSDLDVLRPFYLIFDTYERHTKGYRVKCCPMKVKISNKSVQDKISVLTDKTQNVKCKNAYTFLMSSQESSYSHFVLLREQLLATNNY